MTFRTKLDGLIALSMAGALLGCSTSASRAQTMDMAPWVPTLEKRSNLSLTERLADDLVRAEAAYDAGDTAALAIFLHRIEMRGAEPALTTDPDLIALWRTRVPDTLPPVRGRALGPAFSRGVLQPGKTMATEQLFLSGKAVTVTVGVGQRRDVRLRIMNAQSRTVCEQEPAHARDCKFTPLFTQRYRIELHNIGTGDARYFLVVD